jgi:hypothetical protein
MRGESELGMQYRSLYIYMKVTKPLLVPSILAADTVGRSNSWSRAYRVGRPLITEQGPRCVIGLYALPSLAEVEILIDRSNASSCSLVA